MLGQDNTVSDYPQSERRSETNDKCPGASEGRHAVRQPLTEGHALLFLFVDVARDAGAQQQVRRTNAVRHDAEQIQRRVGMLLHEREQLAALKFEEFRIFYR